MEIFIYKTYEQWYKDKPYEVLEGSICQMENGLIAVDTYIDNKNYIKVVDNFNDIDIYHNSESWRKSKPEISFSGEVCERECSDNYFVFINEDGYKQYLSLNGIYSVVYER